MVTFFQKTSVSLRKKAITIASPQKFDHRSSQSVAFLVALQSKSLVAVNKGFRVHSMSGASCDCQKTKSNRYQALGLLLADGTPTVGGGKTLTGQPDFFTETVVTPERKVEKSFPRWEINRHAEG